MKDYLIKTYIWLRVDQGLSMTKALEAMDLTDDEYEILYDWI